MNTSHKTTADNAEIIAAAIHAACPQKNEKRGTFPRFNVRADGETHNASTVRELERELGYSIQGETVYVFRNNGYGATITFDKPEWWDSRAEFAAKFPHLV